MGKYALLQCKRLARVLVWILPAMAALLVCLGLGGKALINGQNAQASRQEFPIGLVGVPDSGMLRMGLNAIDSLDDLGFAVELIELTAEEAPQALESDRVRAYVVIPEGFVSAANRGELKTIAYVSKAQAAGINTLFQQEVTAIIGQVLLQSQKASFGSYDALEPYVGHDRANHALNALSEELAEFVFLRNRTGTVALLGFDQAPSFAMYLACGLSVTLALMVALSFAPLTVQQNIGVNTLLRARGRSDILQGIVDYFAIFAGEFLVIAVLLFGASIAVPQVRLSLLLPAVPVCALAAALAFFCFSLSRHLLSGLLLYFFTALSMALVSGCMYPAWFFPVTLQRLAAWLPAGLAREYLTAAVTGIESHALWGLLGYTAIFAALGIMLRARRIRRNV